MTPMQPLKRQKLEEYTLQNYPCDLLQEFIYQAILQKNNFITRAKEEAALVTFLKLQGIGFGPFFDLSSFESCFSVCQRWRRCAESAAIQFANSQGMLGYNFLRRIDTKLQANVNPSNPQGRWLKDLLQRRGHEIYSFVNAFVLDRPKKICNHLKYMPNVHSICLYNEEFSAQELEEIKAYGQKFLNCQIYSGSKNMLAYLGAQFSNLKRLHLECKRIDRKGFKELGHLSQLEELIVRYWRSRHTVQSEGEFNHVIKYIDHRFTRLNSLTFHASDFWLDAKKFRPPPVLQNLDLSILPEHNFTFKTPLPSLNRLVITHMPVDEASLGHISNLKSLKIKNRQANIDLARLHQKLPQLKEIEVM